MIEFGGAQSWQHREFLLPTFVQSVNHQKPDVRQASIYGIAVAAGKSGPEYNTILPDFFALPIQLIASPDPKPEDNNLCTENAISANTKFMKYNSECLPAALRGMNAFIVRWLGWLLIWDDALYRCLCNFLEANNPASLKPDNANLPHIVKAVRKAVSAGDLSDNADSDDRLKPSTASGDHSQSTSQQNGLPVDEGPFARQRYMFILRHTQSDSYIVEASVNQPEEEQRSDVKEAVTGSTKARRR